MKCEKCNQNEATFYYRATINGKTEEKRLCADCAREEGLDKAFDWNPGELLGGFWGDEGSLFGDFFGGGMLPGMARTMLAPLLTFPQFAIGPAETETEETAAPAAAPEEKPDAALNTRRELNALRHQLREAVRAENYEKAIELRDKIKDLEK